MFNRIWSNQEFLFRNVDYNTFTVFHFSGRHNVGLCHDQAPELKIFPQQHHCLSLLQNFPRHHSRNRNPHHWKALEVKGMWTLVQELQQTWELQVYIRPELPGYQGLLWCLEGGFLLFLEIDFKVNRNRRWNLYSWMP